MLGNCTLQFPKKGRHVLNSTPKASPAPLCPIPRNGLQGSAAPILYVCLLLSSLLVGLGVTFFDPAAEAAALGIPEIVTAAAILVLVIHMWRVTRTAKGALPLLIALGVFLTMYSRSIYPAGVLCGLVFTVSEGSLLIAVQPKSKLASLPIIPLLAYGITALLSMDFVSSLAVLLPWPAAWALAVGTRRCAESEDGPNRVGVICSASLALGLTTAALLAISLYQVLGTLEPAVLAETLDALREEIILAIHTQPLPEGLSPEVTQAWEEQLEYANVENQINTIFNVLPAICTVTVLIFVTVCQSIQHAALRAFGMGECITTRVKAFEMSLISCVVFPIAYLFALVDSGAVSSLAGTVALNVAIILMPGLALAGLLRLTRGLARKGARGMGCLFYLIISAFCLLFIAPYVLAAVEVIGHIFEAITAKLRFDSEDDDPFGKH